MNRLGIFFSLVLIGLGVGVVRPFALRKADEAWDPVLAELDYVPFALGERVHFDVPGDYIVFFEGAADDAVWLRQGPPPAWADFVDFESHQALPSTTHGIDYGYEASGRRGVALCKLTVRTPGFFTLEGSVNGMEVDRETPRFRAAITQAGLVDSQAWESTLWFSAGIAGLGVLAVGVIYLLMRPRA